LSLQALPATPESLCLVSMGGSREERETERIYLNIGLQNGVLLRTVLDEVNGDLSDTRTRYLGTRPVKLFRVKMQGREAVVCTSSRVWLFYYHQSRFHLTPLSYEALEFASGFSSSQCPEGIVAISTNTLRILALEKLGAVFNQQSFPIDLTPRKFVVHPESGLVITIETDHNAYTEKSKQARKQQMAEEMIEAAGEEEQQLAAEMAAAFLSEKLDERCFGAPRAGPGQWASIIRILEPTTGETIQKIELDQNEAATSLALVRFAAHGDVPFILVGIAREMQLNPRKTKTGTIHVYRLLEDGRRLELMHVTPVEDVVHAMCPFIGRVAVGVGKWLRVYDLGKKKLLRKTENRHIPNAIVSLQAMGSRLYVGDVQESAFFVKYKREDNQLVIFADDTLPRWTTASCVLDYDTVAVADKFGNLSLLRLPPNVNDEIDEDPTGVKSLWDRGWLGGASQKVDTMACYHLGEMILTLQRTTLIPGLSECLLYTTISGSIGVFVPFSSHEDHDFFQHLEMHLRSENPPLCGRDHLAYRSAYYPLKNVIDGDLCEQFNTIDSTHQRTIAEELDRRPIDVSKKLEDIRTQYAF